MSKLYEVDVIVNNRPVTKYAHEGDTYIEGRPSSSYQIRIRNNSWSRVKAVVSVDGLSILDGEPASENGKGYIINAKEALVLNGWRTSTETENQFVFGAKRNSYSAKTGSGTENTGVIAVAFFQEKPQSFHTTVLPRTYVSWNDPHPFEPLYFSSHSTMDSYTVPVSNMAVGASLSASSGNMRSAKGLTQNLGTGYGEEVESRVTEVAFQAYDTASGREIVYYDDRRGLEARGIVVDPRKMKPDPFPASNTGYCKRL